MSMNKRVKELMDSVPGWCFPEKAQHLYEIVSEIKPKINVEIGVYGGKSFLSMGLAHSEVGGELIGIDPWSVDEALQDIAHVDSATKGTDWNKLYTDLDGKLKENNFDLFAKLIRDTSLNASKTFADKSVDMLHIDGNHTTEKVTIDLNAWLPKLKDNAILVMDDLQWPTVQKAIDGFSDRIELDDDRCILRGGKMYWGVFKKK